MRSSGGTHVETDSEAPKPGLVILRRAAVLGLVWVLPLYPLIPRFHLAGPLGIDDIIPLLTVGLSASALLVHRRRPARLGILGPLAVVALLTAAPAMVMAVDSGASLVALARTSGRLLLYGTLVVAVEQLLDGGARRRMLVVLVAVAAFEGAYGLVAYAGALHGPWQMGMLRLEHSPDPGPRLRVQGTFGGELPAGETYLNRANFYSAYLAVALMALVTLWRRHRWWTVVAAALILGGIVVSYTRMSLLAVAAGGAAIAVCLRRWRIIAAVAVVSLVVVLGFAPLRHRFVNAGTDRIGQWQIASRVIAEHPALGTGDGNYLSEAQRLGSDVAVARIHTPHNSVLYAAASYGVGAGLALMGLYGFALWAAATAWRRRRSDEALLALAATVVFVVHDLTNNLFFVPAVALVWWIIWAAAARDEAAAT